MSKTHKCSSISFHITDEERKEIDAKAKVCGMLKKEYFVRSCIYNRVCVVGKKETIYPLVEELQSMQLLLKDIAQQFQDGEVTLSKEGLAEMQEDYINMIKAITWLLDGAKYLWMDEKE